MEFISAEEFLKQDEKVQKVFLDWWKPSIGDLFFRTKYKWILDSDNKDDYEEEIQCVGYTYNNKLYPTVGEAYNHISNNCTKEETIPLLTEGQLRQFIEDYFKEDSKIELEWFNNGYAINVVSKFNDEKLFNTFYTDDEEPLQAYWQVALGIAQ